MSKNTWITLITIIIVLVSLALVLLLILIPQSSEYLTGINYDAISKNEYSYEDTKYDPQKEENWEMHEVETADITKGTTTGSYVPGNINPFTPKDDITIYNEPGYTGGSTSSSNSTGSTVTLPATGK